MKIKFSACLLILFFLFFLSSFCKKSESVVLIDATSQYSASGINGGINSTEYFFKIKILSGKKIEFDSLWIGKKIFKLYFANNKPSVSNQPISFGKNDTIILRVSDLSSKTSTPISKPPISYEGNALLRYKVKNKISYLIIKTIKSIEGINRP